MVVAGLFVDVNVIDPHNLSPMNVNDLLIEQVALQQQHALTASVRPPLRRGRGNAQTAINQAERLRSQQTVAVTGFDHEAGDQAGILLRHERDFAHFAGICAGVIDDDRANQVRKCERRHCCQYIR